MAKKDTSLGDIAQSITDLGNLMTKELSIVKKEQIRQGVLLEDAMDKFDENIDLLTKQMGVKARVDDHQERIENLESGQKTIKSVVTVHSRQLEGR